MAKQIPNNSVKKVPNNYPIFIFLVFSYFTPLRVSRLEVLDKVIFRVDTESMPSVQARGSLKQRLNSAMFNQSDFNTNNVIFPEILHLARDSTDHVQTRYKLSHLSHFVIYFWVIISWKNIRSSEYDKITKN